MSLLFLLRSFVTTFELYIERKDYWYFVIKSIATLKNDYLRCYNYNITYILLIYNKDNIYIL